MPPRTDRQELSARLGRTLGCAGPGVLSWLQDQLDREDVNYIRKALGGGLDEWGDLVDAAARILEVARTYPGSARRATPGTTGPPDLGGQVGDPFVHYSEGRADGLVAILSDDEARRSAAFSEALAGQASRVPAVLEFRHRVLGGEVLTDEQARAFLSSAALGVLPIGALEEAGIPAAGHRVESFRAIQLGRLTRRVELRIDPPGLVIERELEGSDRHPIPEDEGMEWNGSEVWPDSVLAWLRALGVDLARHCMWSETEAVLFVLTGRAPYAPPIRMSMKIVEHAQVPNHVGYRRGQITLRVDPWISGDTVLRAYRLSQRQLLGHEGGRGFKNRPSGSTTLDAFLFVERHRDATGATPPLRVLARRWNEVNPDKAFTDPDKFGRAYHRGRREVLGADYRLPAEAYSRSSELTEATDALFIGPLG